MNIALWIFGVVALALLAAGIGGGILCVYYITQEIAGVASIDEATRIAAEASYNPKEESSDE